MTRYLLDTNIVSDLVRNPQGKAASRIAEIGEANVCTSIVVAAELRYGVAKRGSERLASQVERIFDGLSILPFEEPADAIYGVLRRQLETAGVPVGGNDMLIAAHALALGCVMVTDNEREFSRIGDLTVVNWLR